MVALGCSDSEGHRPARRRLDDDRRRRRTGAGRWPLRALGHGAEPIRQLAEEPLRRRRFRVVGVRQHRLAVRVADLSRRPASRSSEPYRDRRPLQERPPLRGHRREQRDAPPRRVGARPARDERLGRRQTAERRLLRPDPRDRAPVRHPRRAAACSELVAVPGGGRLLHPRAQSSPALRRPRRASTSTRSRSEKTSRRVDAATLLDTGSAASPAAAAIFHPEPELEARLARLRDEIRGRMPVGRPPPKLHLATP